MEHHQLFDELKADSVIFLALSDSKSNTIILVIAMSDILRSERNQLLFSEIKHPTNEVSGYKTLKSIKKPFRALRYFAHDIA